MFYAPSRPGATRRDDARHFTARERARRELESRQRTREMAITKEFNVPVDRVRVVRGAHERGGVVEATSMRRGMSKRRGRIERVCGRARWRRGARTR